MHLGPGLLAGIYGFLFVINAIDPPFSGPVLSVLKQDFFGL